MRIGLDCRLWGESGVGRYTRNLVHYIQKLDKENEYVLFILSKDYEQIKFQISNLKFQIVRADIRWHSFEEQWRFLSILNSHKLDLVHFPYFSLPVSYQGKFVVTIHDLILHHFPTGQASTLNPLFYKIKLVGYKYVIYKTARKARKIITVTNATKHEIIQHLKVQPNKIVVTPEGVDERISSSKFQDTNKSLNTKYFLYVGNAYPHKNLSRLLEGFSLMHAEYNVKLILVGKEDYFYKRLKEEAEKMELSDAVFFLGYVSDSELAVLYKNALAFVIPSVMEGFGLPGLEAMANKCLVLASDIAAHKEVYAAAAVYFNPLSIESIAKKMRDVCLNDSKHFNKMREEGLKKAKQFSWEKMTRETLKIYTEVLSK